MQSMMTLDTTKGRHMVSVPRCSGQFDAMWCGHLITNHFAYATKRLPRPKELLLT